MQNIRKALLSWYRTYQRKLPWRETKDPYSIWISEVMLQQTKVDTVIPYYKNFLSTFPTVASLANAPEEQILKAWEGLGYYRRARHLHAAAKEVTATYGGDLPRTRDELLNLKGFGPYTSASVASIAFDEPVACVDGNVRRVISRLFAMSKNIEALAQDLLETKDPSSFNQAVMELGALICTPTSPKCLICPVQKNCQAYQTQQTHCFPITMAKAKPKEVFAFVFVPKHRDTYFVEQRAANERWANMWQFPMLEYEIENVAKAKKDFEKTYGMTSVSGSDLMNFKHQLTHRTMHVHATIQQTPSKTSAAGEWLTIADIRKKPLSRLCQKILARL